MDGANNQRQMRVSGSVTGPVEAGRAGRRLPRRALASIPASWVATGSVRPFGGVDRLPISGAPIVARLPRIGNGPPAFTFAIEADPHLDVRSDPSIFGEVIDSIVATSPAFLIDLGDTLMVDTLTQPTISNILDRASRFRQYFDRLGDAVPLHMVIGNHDGEAGWAPSLARLSNDVRREAFPASVHARNYRAFTHGDALFVLLDPFGSTTVKPNADPWAWTLGREQYEWLARTLEASTETWRFVFIHHLVGGDRLGRGGVEVARRFEWGGCDPDGSLAFAARRPGWGVPIHDLFVDWGVTAVFKGHDHLYAHQELDGITYQTLPQPSHPGESVRQAAEYGYVTGTVRGGSGFLSVTVEATVTTVRFVKWNPRTGMAVDASYELFARVVNAQAGRLAQPEAPS